MRIENLEDLSSHLIDQWKSNQYIAGEYIFSGRDMAEIFIAEARRCKLNVEESDIMSQAEQLEEWIEEAIKDMIQEEAEKFFLTGK